MKTQCESNELNRLEKRAIEASALVPVIQALALKIGKQAALAILQEVNEKEAFQRGDALRRKLGQTGISDMVEDVATWGDGGSMEMEVLEQSSEQYCFNVTRCPYHDLYRELGFEEYGVAMSCCRDKPFALGLNPKLVLERSQTLMEGAAYCDFRYTLGTD